MILHMNIEEFIARAAEPIGRFTEWVERVTPNAIVDHIGFKCTSSDEYETLRKMLEPESRFVYQSFISSRRIAVIRLKHTFHTPLGEVSVLELSDQKPDGSQTSGFDHIEIYPVHGTMQSLANLLGGFEKISRPHHTTYDLKIHDEFKVRLESEALITKIVREEIFFPS